MSTPAIDFSDLGAKPVQASGPSVDFSDLGAKPVGNGTAASSSSGGGDDSGPSAVTSDAYLSTLKDLGVGAVKGLTSTATAVPAMLGNALNSALGYQKPQRVTDEENYLVPTNTAQAIGKYGEQAAEILAPVVAGGMKVASALDFSAKKQAAGALLQSVASDANQVPVELENSSDAALKLIDWQGKTQLGPTINKFLNRITSPKLGPLTYEEGRDYYQLLGRLSSDETSKLAPTIQRNLAEMVSGLKTDLGNAADQVGRAADYYKGMGDYASASKYQGWYDTVKDSLAGPLVKGAAYGIGGAAAGGTAYKLWQWLTGK